MFSHLCFHSELVDLFLILRFNSYLILPTLLQPPTLPDRLFPKPKSKFSFSHKEVFGDLTKQVAANSELLKQIERTFIPEERDRFTSALWRLLPHVYRTEVKDIFSAFSTHCR